MKQKKTAHFPVRLLLITVVFSGVILAGLFVFSSLFLRQSWPANLDKNILLIKQEKNGLSKQILFAHISPSLHKVELVTLNPVLSVNLIGSIEALPLQEVMQKWDQQPQLAKYLPAVYSFGLGKVIDEVWVSETTSWSEMQPNFDQLAQQVFFNKFLTPLGLGDRFWLYRFAHTLRPDQVQESTVTTAADWQKTQASSTYADQPADCSFAVVNTIGVTGVGTKVGKILESSGFSIVRITDEEAAQSTTQLVVGSDAQKCQNQQIHVEHALPVTVKVVPDAARANQYRASMVLIIGADLKPFF